MGGEIAISGQPSALSKGIRSAAYSRLANRSLTGAPPDPVAEPEDPMRTGDKKLIADG
jgi:hypothetical protein